MYFSLLLKHKKNFYFLPWVNYKFLKPNATFNFDFGLLTVLYFGAMTNWHGMAKQLITQHLIGKNFRIYVYIYKYILYNGSICIVNLQFALFQKEWKKSTMKWYEISTQWLCILTAKKRNDIYEQMLHKLCVKQEQRETERERER